MKRLLENLIVELSKKSGYTFGFLFDRFNDMMDSGEVDWNHFVDVSMEHGW